MTPWSPLKSGILSGEHTRENDATIKKERRQRAVGFLDEKSCAMIDELEPSAEEQDARVARVALA